MRLLVGLGNTGEKYERTRHNAGFWCIDAVAKALGVSFGPKEFKGGLLAEAVLQGEKVLLFKPQQFMNRSGQAIGEVQRYFEIPVEDVCVIADDVYVLPGSIRIRRSGGDGGHNGWKSVIEHLDPDTFLRVKIGVGLYEQHPEKRLHQPPLDEYVLQPLPAHEKKSVEKAIDNIVPNLIEWLEQGKLEEETLHL